MQFLHLSRRVQLALAAACGVGDRGVADIEGR
jgi:hypothetical protein